jgi:hypothetical protein
MKLPSLIDFQQITSPNGDLSIIEIEKKISEGVYFEYLFKIIIEGIIEILIFSILNY